MTTLKVLIAIFFSAIAGALIWALIKLHTDLKKEANAKEKKGKIAFRFSLFPGG